MRFFYWLVLVALGSILVIAAGFYAFTGSKLEIAAFNGQSMKDTIPAGSLIFLARENQMKLQNGDIGCYNDPLSASLLQQKRYEQCHHVNGSYYAEDDIHTYYKMHTDRVECTTNNEGMEICNIIEYDVSENEVIGKVVGIGPNFWMTGIGIFLLLIFAWYFFENDDRKNEGKKNGKVIVRQVFAKGNMQH